VPRRADTDLSLLGTSAQDEFRRHQATDFLRFWRTAVPAALAVIIAAVFGANFFLARTLASLQSQRDAMHIEEGQEQALLALRARIADFNQTIGAILGVMEGPRVTFAVFESFDQVFREQGVSIVRMTHQNAVGPISVLARTKSEENIASLRAALEKMPNVTEVDIPLTEVTQAAQGVSFSLRISIAERVAD
jgi:hypothetical protein